MHLFASNPRFGTRVWLIEDQLQNTSTREEF